MAGFWHLSHHQMRDLKGEIYDGALATFYAADTLNKIIVYADYGLGTPLPNPVPANAYGIFPPVFMDEAVGFYRQRITSKGGVLIPGTDVGTLPIIGPGEGGGGSEVPVDPNGLIRTGYPLWLPTTGALAGFVRMNARTIGSAVSGASERANADCESLYSFLYAFDNSICPVTGGRGANVGADWSANKPIGLLDMRGRGPFGIDDMGNSSASRLNSSVFSAGSPTEAAAVGGSSVVTLDLTQIPGHTHTATVTDPGHFHTTNMKTNAAGGSGAPGGDQNASQNTNAAVTGISVSNSSAGGGLHHSNMSPFMLGTWYLRL